MRLMEHPELPFLTQDISRPVLSRAVAETDGIRSAVEATTVGTAKDNAPIDNDDVEVRRRRDGGEYSSEKIRCGAIRGINRFRRNIGCWEGPVP